MSTGRNIKGDELPLAGESFGQAEPLTTRLQNILRDYPCDETILKELLQNADDAKATKMYVILDKRTHGGRVFSDAWKELQGPALLVWNDSIFKEDDIVGIQKVGFGSKRSDTETIGQYGIGFNVVYHLTDCPSLISNGETMCIFDPHCRYVPRANEQNPGRRFRIDSKFWEMLPGLKSAYLCESLEMKSGTLFRLPLRYREEMVKASKVLPPDPKPQVFDARKMERELESWAPHIKESMFFLKNITDIKFFVIEDATCQATLKHHFSININQDGKSRLAELDEAIQNFSHSSGCEPKIITYRLTLTESTDGTRRHENKARTKNWLIQQGIGDMNEEVDEWSFIRQMKPKHGIAVPLDGSEPLDGRVYCFLPLPVKSHLPVHINGQFVLDTARRGLWQPSLSTTNDPKAKWNQNILSAIASSYLKLLTDGRRSIVHTLYQDQDTLKKYVKLYYSLFPDPSMLQDCWKEVAVNLYRRLQKCNAKVLAVIERNKLGGLLLPDSKATSKEEDLALCLRWLPLQSLSSAAQQVHFYDCNSNFLPHSIAPVDTVAPVGTVAPPVGTGHSRLLLKQQLVRATINGGLGNSIGPARPSCTTHSQALSLQSQFHNNSDAPLMPTDDYSQESILEMIGMVLTIAPMFIKSHLDLEGSYEVPLVSPHVVYEYFQKFSNNILPEGGKFPCDIEESKFKSIQNFKTFCQYILQPCKDQSKYMCFVGSTESLFPEGLPLLLTADKNIRMFESTNKVLASQFWKLFPSKCHHKFLHPDLLDLQMVPQYFVTTRDTCGSCTRIRQDNDHVRALLAELLPTELMNTQADIEVINHATLKLLWECLENDLVFGDCINTVLSKWALLPSTSQQLFSSKSSLLPLCDSSQDVETGQDIANAIKVLLNRGVPFLQQWVPTAAHKFCPQMTEPTKVLQNLVHFHKSHPLTFTEGEVEVLLSYFKCINFEQDTNCVPLIRSLPFYKTINGELVACDNTNACVCPQAAVFADANACFKANDAILLDHQGIWTKHIKPSVIGINELCPEEIYTRYIYKSFHLLNETQRYKHLKYIRDTMYYYYTQSKVLEELKTLKCIGPDGSSLKYVSDFCDHTARIFMLCKNLFCFLPQYFVNNTEEARWLQFFKMLNLKVDVTEKEFRQLVEMVKSGTCNGKVEDASVTLLHCLLETKFKDSFLREASRLPFVVTKDLSHLTWITPACTPKHVLQTNGRTINMTSLSGACYGKDEELLWAVRPVVDLPTNYISEPLQRTLGVFRYPSFEEFDEVLNNIKAISKSHLSNEALFDKSSSGCHAPECGTNLIAVMQSAFRFLKKVEKVKQKQQRLNTLDDVACIPVYTVTNSPSAAVLVRPSQVIASDEACNYYPFLHRLPDEFHEFLNVILEPIGVMRSINAEHLCIVLELAYKRSNGQPLDVNTMRTVQLALKALYTLLLKKDCGTNLSPLYLPDSNGRLNLSTSLAYCDNVQYSPMLLGLSNDDIRIFCISSQPGIQEEFCCHLSEQDRPKPLSSLLSITAHRNPANKTTPLVAKLKHTISMPELLKAIVKILKRFIGNGLTEDLLRDIMSHIQVIAVQDLGHSIKAKHLQDYSSHSPAVSWPVPNSFMVKPTKHDDEIERTKKLKFEIIEESGHCHLFVDSQAHLCTPTHKMICDGLADWIINHVMQQNTIQSSEMLFQLKGYISTLLMAQHSMDVQDVLQMLNLNTDASESNMEPRLGEPIPTQWHGRLDQAPNYLFRPQEWVGYKKSNGEVVFAQIVSQIPAPIVTDDVPCCSPTVSAQIMPPIPAPIVTDDVPPCSSTVSLEADDDECIILNPTSYKIYIRENDDTEIVVSSRKLYKFI